MRHPGRHPRNINQMLSGAFLIVMALIALAMAWPLRVTSSIGLGPGYIPKVLVGILIVLGLANMVVGFLSEGEDLERWHLRPLAFVLGSIVFFALTIERLGLVISLIGLVMIACAANPKMSVREAVVLAVGTAVFCVIVFVKALGLPVMVWPSITGA